MEPRKAKKRCRSPSRLPRYGRSKCLWREIYRFSNHRGRGAHIRCFLRHADNHRRHVPERRLHAQLSLRNLLAMVFKSRLCHNMIPLYVKIRKHAVSPCAQAGPCPTSFQPLRFSTSRKSGSGHRYMKNSLAQHLPVTSHAVCPVLWL